MREFVITSETTVFTEEAQQYIMQAKACWCMTVKMRGRSLMNEGELGGEGNE